MEEFMKMLDIHMSTKLMKAVVAIKVINAGKKPDAERGGAANVQ